ncbi:glycosyltransferase [Corallococcus sp. AB049A]|uniref:glycosyltransferase n=1 Tax=Corallococcus sp. AB049A TaxID=2316721 RepID=UPI001F46A5F4|nr:glycosyltransferase [Corallococcus sp. AB049A]
MAAFEDPSVGCVTHPVAGLGEKTFGSLLDNLHLSSSAAAGMIAAKHVADRDIVVGKSMALRREDVEALGGFFSVKDVLAEDYVIGQWVTRKLGKRVVLAHTPSSTCRCARAWTPSSSATCAGASFTAQRYRPPRTWRRRSSTRFHSRRWAR